MNWSEQWQETRSASLRGQIRAIVEAIEAAAPELVAKLEKAEREAEIRRQQWLEQEARRQREKDHRRIERWSDVMNIERFLAGVEQSANELSEPDRGHVLERLALARAFLGRQDPLNFFRDWRTPDERYTPRYASEERSD